MNKVKKWLKGPKLRDKTEKELKQEIRFQSFYALISVLFGFGASLYCSYYLDNLILSLCVMSLTFSVVILSIMDIIANSFELRLRELKKELSI